MQRTREQAMRIAQGKRKLERIHDYLVHFERLGIYEALMLIRIAHLRIGSE